MDVQEYQQFKERMEISSSSEDAIDGFLRDEVDVVGGL
jgi:hypothetical protein